LLKKETWSGTIAGSVERTFDAWFRDSTEKVNGGSEVRFRYDDDGLLAGAGSLFVHRRSSDGLVDSTRAGVMGSHACYRDLGELVELQYTMADTVFFKQHHGDALGRITRLAETVDSQNHTKVSRYDVRGGWIPSPWTASMWRPIGTMGAPLATGIALRCSLRTATLFLLPRTTPRTG
jgi:hypothetical protein